MLLLLRVLLALRVTQEGKHRSSSKTLACLSNSSSSSSRPRHAVLLPHLMSPSSQTPWNSLQRTLQTSLYTG